MKVAVLGPVTRDEAVIDGNLTSHIGGIPYYIGLALKNLGVEVIPYISFGEADQGWVLDGFDGVRVRHIPAEKTLTSRIEYSSASPDIRKHKIEYYKNLIAATGDLVSELEKFNYVIFGPLFHNNIDREFFPMLKHKKLVLGNFGMFTYEEDKKFIRKNPENLISVLSYLDYLFLDNNEAFFVSGKETIEGAADFLLGHGLGKLIITEGSKGSHVFIHGVYYRIPAFVPKVFVDSTGAGDTYEAAFIRATELFDDPQKQGEFAAMVATMSLEKRGAFTGKLAEVIERLAVEQYLGD